MKEQWGEFRERFSSQIFEKKIILTVVELYVIESFREVFKQPKSVTSLCFHDRIGLCQNNTRRKENGSLSLNCCRTVTRYKSEVDNRLGKALNWFKGMI